MGLVARYTHPLAVEVKVYKQTNRHRAREQ